MHLDDIESAAAPKAEEYLSKIRAIRRCALPVIQMIAQLEDFQKKLWLKKKFVVETRYCLTLDRVPESLYSDICATLLVDESDADRVGDVEAHGVRAAVAPILMRDADGAAELARRALDLVTG